ncbi:MAG TPA: integrase core domain-containing protein [Solirubrobacteraceae bacterium]|nr:integrase core domain-containing protein [Solirubrobacteraceae bacterium]
MARYLVEAHVLEGRRVSELAAAHGVHRNKALQHWLEHYNTRRPHSGIANQPPISRVHNLRGQNN